MKRAALSAALKVLGLAGSFGCRDWDRFEPALGGGDPTGGSNSGAGNVGAGNVGGGPQGGDQGGGPSGGGPVGGSPALDCGKIDILNDDFESPLDWRWTGDTFAVSVAGGELLVPQPDGEETYFQIDSSASFDLRGRTMVLELSVPPGPGQSLWWDIARDHENYLEFYIDEAGVLNYGYEINNAFVTFDSEQFNASLHRFMRFREANGEGYYDTSPDGAEWTERATFSIDSVWDPAFTAVYIGGHVDGVTPSDGDMHIARIYAEGDDTSVPCPASSFSDDFDDNQKSGAWYRGWFSGASPIAETGGELRITCAAGADASSGYVSSSAYDLRGSAVSIEVIDSPAIGSGGYMALGVGRPNAETFFQFELKSGEVNIYIAVDDNWTSLWNGPYDAVAGRFLRIREAGGTMYFETSPDNQTFAAILEHPVSFPVSEVLVFALGGGYLPSAPLSLAFDNLNVAPGP